MNPLMNMIGPMNGMSGMSGGMGNPMQMLMNMNNPQQFAQQLLNQNPQAQQFLNQMQNQANGRSPRDMAMQMAKQSGMDEKQLLEFAKRFGLN